MTEAGGKYGRMFDTTRRHGKGSQQQLKWSPALIGILRTAMIAGRVSLPLSRNPRRPNRRNPFRESGQWPPAVG
ncbi:hypothetical protein RAA17_12305 [Komagataeibacter rhaeticus]|nr:hypothetical protein [Komagataeibacter rhaeticus]